MDAASLFDELQVLKAYKNERVRIGTICVEQHLVPELIVLCRPKSGVSHQACWCLEQSYLLFEVDCYPFMDDICELLPLKINHSGRRSLLKICWLICQAFYLKKSHSISEFLTIGMREQLVDGAFDELICAHGKTANLMFATRSLYLLGTEFEWIHPQLPAVIREHMGNTSNKGYLNVGKSILSQLGA